MRRPHVLLCAVAAVAALFVFTGRARADDTYLETLRPGADAGSLALNTYWGLDGGVPIGSQVMVRCDYFEVNYRLCDKLSTSCSSTLNDSRIDANLDIDICVPGAKKKLSLFRTYDGGVPVCRVYNVNPPSPGCP